MTNPVTPSQFYWTGKAVQALNDLMSEAVVPRHVVAKQIEETAAKYGKSFIKECDVESYFGYCNAESL